MRRGKDEEISLGLSLVISTWVWFAAAIVTIVCFTGGLLLFPFSLLFEGKSRRLLHGVAVVWAKGIIGANPIWDVKVSGLENIDKKAPYLVVANHQSMLDILVLLVALPNHFKFLAKKELFSIPFAGWHMSLAGYIPVDRSSRESGAKAVYKAIQWFKDKVGVLFFPEGTRSLDGEIKTFKIGAFKIARDQDVSVLPVVLDGTGDALPKSSRFLKKRCHFYVSVLAARRIEKEGVDVQRDAIRDQMVQALKKIRA